MRNSLYLDARQHHIATCLDAIHLVELSRQGISGNGPYIRLVIGKIEKKPATSNTIAPINVSTKLPLIVPTLPTNAAIESLRTIQVSRLDNHCRFFAVRH